MPAYNFKARFAPDIKSGKKRQTIRHRRKWPTNPGDPLYLYTGMRTKQCEKLRTAVCCGVIPIMIIKHNMGLYNVTIYPRDKEKRRALSALEIERLARDDGFSSAAEMIKFFWKELPFDGEIIRW